MGKTAKGLEPTTTRDLAPRRTNYPRCGRHRRADYTNRRTITTLAGVTRIDLTV
jgi:hypothetical protein